MELNKVIRRQGYSSASIFEKISQDFIELFSGFNGVSFLKTTSSDDTTEFTKIFLDTSKRLYIRIDPNSEYGVRISLHCGDGTKEKENYVYIDQRSAKIENIAYSFAKTDYGVVFSTLPYFTDGKTSISDGYLQNFFTTFQTDDGRTVNGFVFCAYTKDDNGSTNSISYMVTEEHNILESVDVAKCFLGAGANQTVLVNATSYTKPVMANHLYKKIQSEENKFGKLYLNGRTFISGSQFCLECNTENQNN